jgi:hypothetical protein
MNVEARINKKSFARFSINIEHQELSEALDE